MRNSKKVQLMGQVVTITKQFFQVRGGVQTYPQKRRVWRAEELKKPVAGWVVGFRTIYDGHTEYEGDQYESYSYFVFEGHHQCVLVVPWPTMRPIRVPLDGYRLGGTPKPPASAPWTDDSRAYRRKFMKQFPRDARGRWMKPDKPLNFKVD